MTDKRKKLQDKLRRKFGFSTNNNRNRGTILIKPNATVINYISEGGIKYSIVRDLAVVMDSTIRNKFPIYLHITEYTDYGEKVPEDERFKENDDYFIPLSLEELNIINDIANEMNEENDWIDQIKKEKKSIQANIKVINKKEK